MPSQASRASTGPRARAERVGRPNIDRAFAEVNGGRIRYHRPVPEVLIARSIEDSPTGQGVGSTSRTTPASRLNFFVDEVGQFIADDVKRCSTSRPSPSPSTPSVGDGQGVRHVPRGHGQDHRRPHQTAGEWRLLQDPGPIQTREANQPDVEEVIPQTPTGEEPAGVRCSVE